MHPIRPALALLTALAAPALAFVNVRPIGQVVAGGEITAYDRGSARLFTVNGATGSIDIVDIQEPWNPRPFHWKRTPECTMKP